MLWGFGKALDQQRVQFKVRHDVIRKACSCIPSSNTASMQSRLSWCKQWAQLGWTWRDLEGNATSVVHCVLRCHCGAADNPLMLSCTSCSNAAAARCITLGHCCSSRVLGCIALHSTPEAQQWPRLYAICYCVFMSALTLQKQLLITARPVTEGNAAGNDAKNAACCSN